jgi:hypothetical protein
MDDVRNHLQTLMEERGDDCLSISRLLGRNAAYFQQYLRRGVPKRLKEEDRRTLAAYFGINEMALGGPPPPPAPATTILVPRLKLGASAGPGAHADEEQRAGEIGFERTWLRKLSISPDALSIIQVAGDSMIPTLGDGDDILVDRGDGAERLRDGIYVIRLDDALMVKRLAMRPAHRLSVLSDNPAYPGWPDVDADTVTIIGRVIWAGRKII